MNGNNEVVSLISHLNKWRMDTNQGYKCNPFLSMPIIRQMVLPRKTVLLTKKKENTNQSDASNASNRMENIKIVIQKSSLSTHRVKMISPLVLKSPQIEKATLTPLRNSQQVNKDQNSVPENEFDFKSNTCKFTNDHGCGSMLSGSNPYIIPKTEDDISTMTNRHYPNILRCAGSKLSNDADSHESFDFTMLKNQIKFPIKDGHQRKQIYNNSMLKQCFMDFKHVEEELMIKESYEDDNFIEEKEEKPKSKKRPADSSDVFKDKCYDDELKELLKMGPEFFDGDYYTNIEYFLLQCDDIHKLLSPVVEDYSCKKKKKKKKKKRCSDTRESMLNVNTFVPVKTKDSEKMINKLTFLKNEKSQWMRKTDCCLATSGINDNNLPLVLEKEMTLDRLLSDSEFYESNQKTESMEMNCDIHESVSKLPDSDHDTVVIDRNSDWSFDFTNLDFSLSWIGVSNHFVGSSKKQMEDNKNILKYDDNLSNSDNIKKSPTFVACPESKVFLSNFEDDQMIIVKNENNCNDKDLLLLKDKNKNLKKDTKMKDKKRGRKKKEENKTVVNMYHCLQCPLSFLSQRALTMHCNNSHGGAFIFQCENCNTRYNNRYRMNRHQKTCGECAAPVQCKICSKTYGYKASLLAHMKNKHGYTTESARTKGGVQV